MQSLRSLLAACTWLALTIWPMMVHAQQLGSDEVTLKNGGSIRGSVVSVEPGTRVLIVEFGKTEAREIPWAEVADVAKGKFSEQKTDAPKKSDPQAESDDEPAGKGRVKLHVESDEPVVVFERTGAAAGAVGGYGFVMESFREVCSSPCNRVVDGSRGQAFFIAGPGIPGSEAFSLTDKQGAATLRVDAGSSGQVWGGATMVTFGAAGVLTGGTFLLLGALLPAGGSADWPAVGGVTMGVSAGVLAGGIALIATGGTDIEWEASEQARGGHRPRYWLGEF